MKSTIFFAGVLLSLTMACRSGNSRNTDANNSTADSTAKDSAKTAFFPVGSYLMSEIQKVDSIPFLIREYRIVNGHVDSAYIQAPAFNVLARPFLLPQFGDGRFEKDFSESSFMDKTTQSVTLTYSSNVPAEPLSRVDVVAVLENGEQQVQSVYMEMHRVSGDSSILDRMYWKTQKNFEIISLIRVKGAAPITQQLRVVWGNEQQ